MVLLDWRTPFSFGKLLRGQLWGNTIAFISIEKSFVLTALPLCVFRVFVNHAPGAMPTSPNINRRFSELCSYGWFLIVWGFLSRQRTPQTMLVCVPRWLTSSITLVAHQSEVDCRNHALDFVVGILTLNSLTVRNKSSFRWLLKAVSTAIKRNDHQ